MWRLFFLLLLPVGIFAQSGSVSGIILDFENKTPLSEANIVLESLHNGTVSDLWGRFVIQDVPTGEYEIIVRYTGYQEYRQTVNVLHEGIIRLRIEMKQSAVMMEEVAITADQYGILKNKPYRIDVIPAKMIEASPAQNISEVLDYISGVNLSNNFGIFSSKTIVSMRGLAGNDQSRVLVLIDDVPFNKSDGGSVNWNLINKDNIESIEVQKGPGQAIYGSGAMGGVIKINTKKPSKKISGKISTEYGTFNTFSGNMQLSGKWSPEKKKQIFYWNLVGFGRKSDGYITEADQYVDVEDSILVPTFLEEYNFSAKLGFQPDAKNTFEVQMNYFDDKRGNGIKVFDNLGAYSEHDTYFSIFKYRYANKKNILNFRMYYIKEFYDRLYEYMSEGEYKLYDVDSRRADFGSELSYTMNCFQQHSLIVGLNFKGGSVDAADTYYTSTDILSNAGKLNTYAAFAQDKISFLDEKLQMYLGLRLDVANYFDGSFLLEYPSYSIEFMQDFHDTTVSSKTWAALCPNVSLQYRINSGNRVYFSAGRGFRAPTLDDLSRTGKKQGTFKVANPGLKPELLDNYEIGGDWQALPKLVLSASTYFSVGHDFMYYTSTGDSVNMGYKITPIIQKENISKVFIYGFELDLEWEFLTNISLFCNYSYSYSEIKDHQINNPLFDESLEGKHLIDVPNHKVTAGLAYRNSGFLANLTFKYVGQKWINDLNIVEDEYLLTDRYPDYSKISLKLEKKFLGQITTGLSIENALDNIFLDDNGQRSPGRFVMAKLGYAF
jgi:iron complex outermembrane recepter protein